MQTPVFAVVSLSDQRVSVYGVNGKILQSPVSTGQIGLETPAGIFSIVQKKAEHYSNLYGDASMPFMERITWTGIALHAGALPGRPASHGCVRMPHAFAQQLFGITKLGMRVIIAPVDIAPADISHPTLFKPELSREAPHSKAVSPVTRLPVSWPISRLGAFAVENVLTPSPISRKYIDELSAAFALRQTEAGAATKRVQEVKQFALKRVAAAEQAARLVTAAEANLAHQQEQLRTAERNLREAKTPDTQRLAEELRLRTAAAVAEAQKRVETIRAQNQSAIEEGANAAAEVTAAETERDKAAEAVEVASRRLSPVSVFVSRTMRRIYVRQANLPLMEAPISIRDADTPIGTFVYTAMDFSSDDLTEMNWKVVSMYKSLSDIPAVPRASPVKISTSTAYPADFDEAKAALERISIPSEIRHEVSRLLIPGSSLIISDEGVSIETGKDTDFVITMSNEPQGSLKKRHREAPPRSRGEDREFVSSSSSNSKGLPAFALQLGW